MTRKEIESQLQIVRGLKPATSQQEHVNNQNEIERFAEAIKKWARELDHRFEEFEEVQASYEAEPLDSEAPTKSLLHDVKVEVEILATVFAI
jgi:aminoglycoside N3'-acetyltransferase